MLVLCPGHGLPVMVALQACKVQSLAGPREKVAASCSGACSAVGSWCSCRGCLVGRNWKISSSCNMVASGGASPVSSSQRLSEMLCSAWRIVSRSSWLGDPVLPSCCWSDLGDTDLQGMFSHLDPG